MLRKLSAIEIAEGALLADIAVVFQLLFIYLPVGGAFFSLLIPPLFTILVLRRGFYAAIMGVCVAIFIVGVITGFHSVLLTLLECGSGIFLGVTMKLRLHYIPLILIGTTGSAFFLSGTTLLTILLLGQPFLDALLQGIRDGYVGAFSVLGFITPQLGLGNWIFACPVVIIVYYTTTFLVRLLGYDIRPFPDGRINKLIQWFIRLIVRIALKLGLGKYWIIRTLIKEIRRQSIGLGRQKANT